MPKRLLGAVKVYEVLARLARATTAVAVVVDVVDFGAVAVAPVAVLLGVLSGGEPHALLPLTRDITIAVEHAQVGAEEAGVLVNISSYD